MDDQTTKKKLSKEELDEKAKEVLKERKARAKKRRPEYKKKRVVVPTVTAIILVLTGIVMAIHSTFSSQLMTRLSRDVLYPLLRVFQGL